MTFVIANSSKLLFVLKTLVTNGVCSKVKFQRTYVLITLITNGICSTDIFILTKFKLAFDLMSFILLIIVPVIINLMSLVK
jgi:hypothetical protein